MLLLSCTFLHLLQLVTVWPPPGDTGTRRQCSVASFHPSPLLTAAHHPEWLEKESNVTINSLFYIT